MTATRVTTYELQVPLADLINHLRTQYQLPISPTVTLENYTIGASPVNVVDIPTALLVFHWDESQNP